MRTRRKPIPQLDFSNFKETTDIIGTKNNVYLRETYGASKNVPLQPVSEPISPTTALTKAGEDILKMQKKGYRTNFDPNIRPYEIFKDSLVPILKNQISDKNGDNKEKPNDSSEPYQKFWHSTNFVKRTLKEISKLPFPDEINRLTYQTKFDDSITSLVRQMTQIGLLETKDTNYNNTKTDNTIANANGNDNKDYKAKNNQKSNYATSNQNSMVYFITEAKKLRVDIFEQAIEGKLFNFAQLSKDLQNEFLHLDSEKQITSYSVHNNPKHNHFITSYQTSPQITNPPSKKKLPLPQIKRSTTSLNRSNVANYSSNNRNNPSSISSLENNHIESKSRNHNFNNKEANYNNNSIGDGNDEDDEDFDRGVLTNAQRYLNLPPSYRPVPSQLSRNAIARQISKNKDIVKRVGTILTEAISDQSKRDVKTTPVSPRNSISEELSSNKAAPNRNTRLPHAEVITRPISISGTPVRNLSPRQNTTNNANTKNNMNRRSLGSAYRLPKLGQKQRDRIYWEDGDPLNTRVGGYVNQINEMHMIAGDFGISDSMEKFGTIEEDPLPFKMISQSNRLNEGYPHQKNNNCDENEDTFDVDIDGWKATPFESNENMIIKSALPKKESINTASNDNIKLSQTHMKSNSSLSRSNYLSTSSARYAYLSVSNDNVNKDQQNLNLFLDKMSIEVESDQTGLEIHNRLNEIWDHLGFSFQQKITMALKYSETPEASEKLSDSIKFWESVFSAFDRYDRAYKAFKEFLKMSFNMFENRDTVFEQLERDYRDSQSSLRAANDLLHKNFGDDVVLKRKRANDFLACREAKIMRMKNTVGYVSFE